MSEHGPESLSGKNSLTSEDIIPIVMSWADGKLHLSPYDITVQNARLSIESLITLSKSDGGIFSEEEVKMLDSMSKRFEGEEWLESQRLYVEEINQWIQSNEDEILCRVAGETFRVTSVVGTIDGVMPVADASNVVMRPDVIEAVWFKNGIENE